VAYPWIGCGECAVCQKGEELLCLSPRTLGTRRAGGYGTHVIVPHGRYLLPHDGVPQSLAATYTCSGITAFSALKTEPKRMVTETFYGYRPTSHDVSKFQFNQLP